MSHVDDIIKEIDAIAPTSRIINRILELANDPEGSISDLADIVKCDLTLTAKLLKLCNSAYYGFPVFVDSVDQAVKLLGENRVVELAVLGGVGQNLTKALRGYDLKRGELWTCSFASALLAKSFSEKAHPGSDKFLVYTASLLKDIGKVVIEGYVGRSFAKIENLVKKKGYNFDEAETEVIGINHAELGGLIAERWNFSPKMIYFIRNHHLSDPGAREDLETVIIYLIDTVSRMAHTGIGADGLAYRVYDEIFGRLGVSEADVKDLLTEFHLNHNIARRMYHLIGSPTG
ncbi:HDIG domain protein [Desulfosarcina alkanivorans]|uniref:HDIG domain protein n=1 Tax=Desulfosarcina alkanivorans TaxID=571177 RepID=A0A5K7YJ06_9BACT|nr:HDOD domain-containing protein [Desulfosarcina alkanivorans]BBO68100.1 HDIG domain protein [Desulfosarcina alkanivorans]